MRVAVIGAGISGIAAAHVLQKNGHEAIVFEKSSEIGGVWAHAYPEVSLQNTGRQYHLSDFPWPFPPHLHPTGAQILMYLRQAVAHLQIDVRLQHDVIALEEHGSGWLVRYQSPGGVCEESVEYVVVSSGQYTEGKHHPKLAGHEHCIGPILTERDIENLDVVVGKRVVVVGFGKSAGDMATFAVSRACQVHHVFRTPRWLVPLKILGMHYPYALFNRFGTVMMPSWAHPTAPERFLHERLGFVVSGFWHMIGLIFRLQAARHGLSRGQAARWRLRVVLPRHGLVPDLRSAAALAPIDYYRLIAEGRILPHHAELLRFSPEAAQLSDGTKIPCDLVVLSVGNHTPSFPFLPHKYRQWLEAEADGMQLYRHVIHPRIPRLAFAGFNHGFMHVPAVEVATLWLCAHLRGELALPSVDAMEQSIEHVRSWKRSHIHFEPSRSCAVSTRYQQYLDILLKELEVSPYRKLPNVFAEVFGRYGASDYRGVFAEYRRRRESGEAPLHPLPLNT